MPPLDKPSGFGADADKLLELMSSLWDSTQDSSLVDLFSQLGRERGSAEQQASTAQSQLQGAINAPRPETNAAADLVARGAGRAASGLLQSDKPSAQAEQLIKDKQGFLLQQREENLKSLGESYKRAADRAERLGDLENEIKLKEKIESIATKRKEIGDTLRLIYGADKQLEQARLTISGRLTAATLPDSEIANLAHMVARGAPITSIPTEGRTRTKVLLKMDELGLKLIPPTARKEVNSLNGARATLGKIEELLDQLDLPASASERFTKGGKLVIGSLVQSNAKAARLVSLVNTTLAKQVRAMGDVGTLNNQDINRAKSAMPGLTDARDVSYGRLQDLRDLFDEVEDRVIQTYSQEFGPGSSQNEQDPEGILEFLNRK